MLFGTDLYFSRNRLLFLSLNHAVDYMIGCFWPSLLAIQLKKETLQLCWNFVVAYK